MKLSELRPPKGARKTRRRVGRGQGSGFGRTSARGEKGQKSRSGGFVKKSFEGGQMPLYRRLPKRGFTSRKKISGENQYNIVNLEKLNRFEEGAVVDCRMLESAGLACSAGRKAGVKILGKGELTKTISVRVAAVSSGARAKIEAKGGAVEITAEADKGQEGREG